VKKKKSSIKLTSGRKNAFYFGIDGSQNKLERLSLAVIKNKVF
jgi:hypothetical protein